MFAAFAKMMFNFLIRKQYEHKSDQVSGVADLWWVRFESSYSGSGLRNKKCIEAL
ncbi:hypothetical protein ACQUFW_03440 [Acinetobacter johnsonii]|uniref:hypothetical protein n=1 Tax=Acinetobacter johnsonii TaxID=40214 RepID=UPI00244D15CA|nr:hypothetical protein [Acinetobacter johnsonii]MDH1697589.1 hypothetical protein [Acinetobacter johnsonii]